MSVQEVAGTDLRTPFGVVGDASSDAQWEELKARWKAEHDRLRDLYTRMGAEIGDATYADVEVLGSSRSGEWRSRIFEAAP